jgi:hypothetical protein
MMQKGKVELPMRKARLSAGKALLLVAALNSSLGFAQSSPSPSSEGSPATWQSDSVVYVAGLQDIKPGSTGNLRLTPDTLAFTTKAAQGEIPFNRMTSVSIGQERVATGGISAKIVRKIPIYGIGTVAGAATNKSVGLLTVEYRDIHGGHHGVVFEVPKTQAAIAQQQLLTVTKPVPAEQSKTCQGQVVPHTMLIMPILSHEIDLPAEYRVLLYEQMVDELKKSSDSVAVYRMGDVSAPCAATKLQLSVTAFKKGNETIRESTGPIGLFAGVTSIKFQIDLVDNIGTQLFEKSLKESAHGDSDSLSVAHDLAKSVSKRLTKARQIGSQSPS